MSDTDHLFKIGACDDALNWISTQPSLDAAWLACPNPEWMIWYIFRMSGSSQSDTRRKAVKLLITLRPYIFATKHLSDDDRQILRQVLSICTIWADGKMHQQSLSEKIGEFDPADTYLALDVDWLMDCCTVDARNAAEYSAGITYLLRDPSNENREICRQVILRYYPELPRDASL